MAGKVGDEVLAWAQSFVLADKKAAAAAAVNDDDDVFDDDGNDDAMIQNWSANSAGRTVESCFGRVNELDQRSLQLQQCVLFVGIAEGGNEFRVDAVLAVICDWCWTKIGLLAVVGIPMVRQSLLRVRPVVIMWRCCCYDAVVVAVATATATAAVFRCSLSPPPPDIVIEKWMYRKVT
jgi:hypothetical protein